jgi:tetratricopeptide (TPR) repeat protein
MTSSLAKIGLAGVLALAACLPWRSAFAQDHAAGQSGSQQGAPAEPAANVPQSQQKGNPFPGSTTNVPILPSGPTVAEPEGVPQANRVAFPPSDLDPVRSPEEARPDKGTNQGFSSSLSGVDDILPTPTQPTKGKKDEEIAPLPKETPENDISVGNYYLSTKNWRAALSRFQSALVLEPDNPDMYWGLAECERHMGEFALAREHYMKVLEYDPGSKHAKDARKALRNPEIANAKPAPASTAKAAPQ